MNESKNPHSIEAEENLIGSVLIEGDLFPLVDIEAKDFFIIRHQHIWKSFESLHKKDQAIDVVTVTEELSDLGILQKAGGPAALTKILSTTVNPSNYESYAAIVKDKSTRRRQILVAEHLAKGALNGGVDTAEVIEMLSSASRADREGRSIKNGASEVFDEVFEKIKNPRAIWGIQTGFQDLDKKTGGLHKQQTTMISGSPGVGKTTLMLQIALNSAKAGAGVVVFEAEMDEQRMIRRLIEIETKGEITNRMQETGRIPEAKIPVFTQAIETLYSLPIHINDDPGITTSKIRAEVAKLKVTGGTWDLICLDYINLLQDQAGDGKDNNQNAIAKARRFREVCRYLDVAGLSVQSMTKEGMKAHIPHLADMAGPAEVHYSADTVFFLVQDEKMETLYRLLPAKQRDGDSDNKPIMLVRKGLAFYDKASDTAQEEPIPNYYNY